MQVDYDKRFDLQIADCRFDCVDEDLLSSNFPLAPHEKGSTFLYAELWNIRGTGRRDEVLTLMKTKGYRPLTIRELLSLAATHPEVIDYRPIIALGSAYNVCGVGYFPHIVRACGEACIDLDCDISFDSDWRFAVVKI